MPDVFIAEIKNEKEKLEIPLPDIEIDNALPPIRKKMGFLKTFVEHPHGVTFANQKENEKNVVQKIESYKRNLKVFR